MKINRRSFLKGTAGTIIAVLAPVLPVRAVKPTVLPNTELPKVEEKQIVDSFSTKSPTVLTQHYLSINIIINGKTISVDNLTIQYGLHQPVEIGFTAFGDNDTEMLWGLASQKVQVDIQYPGRLYSFYDAWITYIDSYTLSNLRHSHVEITVTRWDTLR